MVAITSGDGRDEGDDANDLMVSKDRLSRQRGSDTHVRSVFSPHNDVPM